MSELPITYLYEPFSTLKEDSDLRCNNISLKVSETKKVLNPLTLSWAKSSRTILGKSLNESWTLQNILCRNVNENITNNSPSNIFKNHSYFQSYHQKYHRCRRQYLEKLVSVNGLTIFFINFQTKKNPSHAHSARWCLMT